MKPLSFIFVQWKEVGPHRPSFIKSFLEHKQLKQLKIDEAQHKCYGKEERGVLKVLSVNVHSHLGHRHLRSLNTIKTKTRPSHPRANTKTSPYYQWKVHCCSKHNGL